MLSEQEREAIFATARKALDAEIDRLSKLGGTPIKLEPSMIIVPPAIFVRPAPVEGEPPDDPAEELKPHAAIGAIDARIYYSHMRESQVREFFRRAFGPEVDNARSPEDRVAHAFVEVWPEWEFPVRELFHGGPVQVFVEAPNAE